MAIFIPSTPLSSSIHVPPYRINSHTITSCHGRLLWPRCTLHLPLMSPSCNLPVVDGESDSRSYFEQVAVTKRASRRLSIRKRALRRTYAGLFFWPDRVSYESLAFGIDPVVDDPSVVSITFPEVIVVVW